MAAREDLKMRLTRLRGQTARLGRTGLSGPAVLRTAEVGIHLMLAAVLAGAEVFGGFAPFGVAMVGASGTGLCGGAALLGAGFGYLTLLGFSDALRYLSAAILTFAVGFAFYDMKLFQRPWTMPGVAGLMNGCTGFIYLSQGGWRTVDVIYFLSEIALTVAAAWCYRVLLLPIRRGSGEGVCSAARRTGALVLVCTTLISLSNLYLWKDVSFGRTLGACLVLAGAWQGGLAAGAVLGVTIGLSMDLAGSGVPLYAMAWGLAALAAGAFRGKKRVWAAAAFAAADGAAVLWTWDRGLTLAILYEVFLGSVAFFMVPERQWKRLGGLLAPAPTAPPDGRAQGYVQKKLEATAAAFRTLYESLRGSFRVPENDNDVAAVFDRAACRVCRTCSLRSSCWERDYVTTFNALNDATAPMLERGRGVASDYPRYFADRCLHFPAFVEAVNQELTALLYRRQYNSRIRESRAAVCRQYGELSALLGTAAAELSRELIPDPAGNQKLRRHLALLGLEMETAVYRDEYGRLRAELKGEGCQTLDTPEELAALSDLLGVPTRAEAGEESLNSDPAGAADGGGGRGSPEEGRGDGERGRRDLLQAGGRHPLCAAVRRHGERARGGPGELPGCPPAGAVPDGGGGDGPRPGHTEFCPGPSGRGGGGVHHSGPAPGGPVHRGGGGVQAGSCPHLCAERELGAADRRQLPARWAGPFGARGARPYPAAAGGGGLRPYGQRRHRRNWGRRLGPGAAG